MKTDGREQRGERTSRALLDSARTAFAQRGYAAASVRDVAREADANPALVRYHFGSKEGLYYRVIDEEMEALRDQLTSAFQVGETVEERVSNLLAGYLAHLTAHPDFPKLTIRASLNEDQGALRIARNHLRPLYEAFEHVIEKVKPSRVGGIEDTVLTIFAAALLPFIYAPILNELFGEDLLAPERLEERRKHLEAVVHMLLETYV